MTHWMFSFSGVLTIAVTWCPLSNACLTTSFPVLPVAPNTTNLNFLEREISSPEAAMFDPYVTPLFPRPLSEWRRYRGDMGIPIPKTLVIWASPVILTLIAKVIWEGGAHITSVLEMGMPISLTVAKTIASHADEPLRPRLSREAKSGKMPFFLGRAFLLAYAYGQLRLSTWSWSRTQIWERDYSARGWKKKPDFFNHCF